MSTPRALIRGTWLNAAPVLLILVGLCLFTLGARQVADSIGAPPGKGLPPAAVSRAENQKPEERLADLARRLDDLAAKREALKDRLEAVSQQAGQNQWLLSIVLAVAGLLTIAQGAFAFFSTQGYVKQADEAVDKIKILAAEVRAKYPLFSQMEDTLEAAFRRLAELAVRLDLDQNLYADSDPRTRQEILALEGLAAMQFVVPSVRAPHVVTQIRLLGKFYADKYVSAGKAIEADFDKALYYFSLELEKSGRDILALNDLGWLHMEIAKNPDKAKATALLLESLDKNPDQQRPLYDLGTMSLEAGDKAKLSQARGYLEKAVGVKNWEKTPNEQFASHLHYNLACVYSCLSVFEQDGPNKKALLDLALASLDKASEQGGTAQSVLEKDIKQDDLAALAKSAEHTAKVIAIAAKFRLAWAARAKA
jgi:TPR repeat protein